VRPRNLGHEPASYDARVSSLAEVVRAFPRPTPGRRGDPGLFGPGSAAWKINRESVLLFGGGRALLMQVAHPLVAAGVAEHSDFDRDPFDRLWRTVDAALTVIFGDTDSWRAAVRRVGSIHEGVRGSRAGEPYSALDPDLLLWVHATLVDSSLEAYATFLRPVPVRVRERYYLEMRAMGTAFGIPAELHPPTYADFRRYVEWTVEGLSIGEESRRVARQVLSPPAPAALLPLGLLGGLASVGLLPTRIRDGLGLRWNRGTRVAFGSLAAATRACVPLLPERVRVWPHALEAERRTSGAGTPAGRA
jgi:uncharacterized protein (DUF2236 family)